ncbi:MAG TPA: alanine--glyoxylate aminotransferase family protein [Candidatus Solibacter sp.]|jgi:aspartate aminotransferase-like enzyme|nr:alanine--glyoxylate aminotransferase family protein [Candidatus Solibacter sp.]
MSYQLRVPGPTPVPERVRQAMDQPMINHRGPAFAALIGECRDGLKWAFQTQNEIVIFPSSGTGGLEAAVQNLTSPGQKALFVTIGAFGDRFAKLGQAYGADVVRLEYQWGHAADPAEIGQKLDENPDIKVVFVTHNETSTGVTNDLAPIVAAIKQRGRLVAVDGVSSVSSINVPTDELGLDVVISGSQKGWMLPPGCSFLSASPSALEFMATTTCPRFYFDVAKELDYELKGQTFTTPAVSILFGLRESLKILRDEGLEGVFDRHARIARGVRAAVTALELELFADPLFFSNTVTAVRAPHGDEDLNKKLIGTLRDKYQLELAGGQASLTGKIFRIGHLGDITENDAIEIIDRLEQGLIEVGYIDGKVGAVDALTSAMRNQPAATPA